MTNKLSENLSGFSSPHSFVRSSIHPFIHSSTHSFKLCVQRRETEPIVCSYIRHPVPFHFVRTSVTLSLFILSFLERLKMRKKIALLLFHMPPPIVHIIFTYSVFVFFFCIFVFSTMSTQFAKKIRSVTYMDDRIVLWFSGLKKICYTFKTWLPLSCHAVNISF